MRRIVSIVVLCPYRLLAVLGCLGVLSSPVLAQVVPARIFADQVGQPGQPIPSWSADPLMTVEQEQEILRKLRTAKPAPKLGINAEVALEQMAESWSETVPVVIDRVSLEGVGLTADTPVMPQRVDDLPLMTQMFLVLRDLELTFTIRGGVVFIETVEAADAKPCVRVYDVSSLLTQEGDPFDSADATLSSDDQKARYAQVIQQTIDPDSWEALGGMGTFAPLTVRDRSFFVIAQRTEVHLAIQRLLDRLNGCVASEIPEADSVNVNSRVTNGRSGIPRFSGDPQ
ncbi:hypothetical protein [Neorhodopirellula lusitana]|uniref:hypothetical protein n=1 Tax=Neorhodopirellula lusitana TaxID=445327 RepID=UPI00384D5FFB